MSNHDWQDLPEDLADFKGMIVVGGEVINGTGEIQARFYDLRERLSPPHVEM